jgi:hypothetical protein
MPIDPEDTRDPLVRCAACARKLPGKDQMPPGGGIVNCVGCGSYLDAWEESRTAEMALKLGPGETVRAYWTT